MSRLLHLLPGLSPLSLCGHVSHSCPAPLPGLSSPKQSRVLQVTQHLPIATLPATRTAPVPSSLWTWNSLSIRLRPQVSQSGHKAQASMYMEQVKTGRGGRAQHNARLQSSTSIQRLCQEDSSHLLPACPLAWLTSLQTSYCPTLLPADLLIPFYAPRGLGAPRGQGLGVTQTRQSLSPT